MRVGILALTDPHKGLRRDAEIALWALDATSLVEVFGLAEVPTDTVNPDFVIASNFPDNTPLRKNALRDGTSASGWIPRLDALLMFEILPISLVALARRSSVRVVYVPNLEWCTKPPEGIVSWVRAVNANVNVVIAKTQSVQVRLNNCGLNSILVPWSVPTPIRSDCQVGGGNRFLMNAGMGGVANRRGTDIALKAFAIARKTHPRLQLTLKTLQPVGEFKPPLEVPEGVNVITEYLDVDALVALHDAHDAVLYPSRFEGFGLSLLEALHRGMPVIATNSCPMCELVEDGHNGLLISAETRPDRALSPVVEPDPVSLASAMVQFAEDPNLRRRLTCPQPGELKARRHAFGIRLRAAVAGNKPPHVLVLHGTGGPRRRSERFWEDALIRHGYDVTCLPYEDHLSIRRCIQKCAFVLAGKIPVGLAQWIHWLPAHPMLVVWHHDWVDFIPSRRAWSDQIAALVDLYAAPHDLGLPNSVQILPGASVFGDRGPGLRARRYASFNSDGRVVFIGNSAATNRLQLLRDLQRDLDLVVYGEGWKKEGIVARPPVYDNKFDAAARAASIALSISNTHGIKGYTSMRLFNLAAVGACVVAQDFPGLENLFSSNEVARFSLVSDDSKNTSGYPFVKDVIKDLIHNPMRVQSMRVDAEERVWRQHSWDDRIRLLLTEISKAVTRRPARPKLKLNLGCGSDLRSGYVNIDWREASGIMQHDLRKPLPFPGDSCVEVVASDILEHFPRDVLRDHLLPEIHRVLQPGGVLVAQMPDLDEMIRQYHEDDRVDAEVTACRLHGRQDYDGNLHYWSYTFKTLTELLVGCGFTDVVKYETINWNMRVRAIATGISSVTSPSVVVPSPPEGTRQLTKVAGETWSKRAERGRQAVGHVHWTEDELDESTQRWWARALPVIQKYRLSSDSVVLDFGCGVGRFLPRLADAFDAQIVYGLDAAGGMLAMAHKFVNGDSRIQLVQVRDVGNIPLSDGVIQVLWTCTVLQHLPESLFPAAVKELRRILADNALVIMFENTHLICRRVSGSGHIVFREDREYLSVFPGIHVVGHYEEVGEQHTLFTGRLRPEDTE